MKTNNEENEYLETLTVLWIKWRGTAQIIYWLHRCCFNYALSKLIVDYELEDLWRRENPDSSDFTRCDRSSWIRSRIDRVYTDIKTVTNTKINHIIASVTDHKNAIFIDRCP